MMMKFFLFSSLAHLHIVMSSPLIPQYDDFGLVGLYHRYLNRPTWKNYYTFESYVRGYYKRSPIDCLNLLDRYRSNRVFKVSFWQALAGIYYSIDPTKIIPGYYSKVLICMSCEIRSIILNCGYSDETKFKTELETISRMIKLAEITASELNSLGENDKLISGFDDQVAIWKYLIRNISFDFINKTIDYNSLFRTFDEVSLLIKSDSSSNGTTLRLSKRYALLSLYIRHIYNNNCNVIFDINHHHKAFIIYLAMECRWKSYNWDAYELYPNILRLLLEKLYENGSLQLDPILELFRGCSFESYHSSLRVSNKISNYHELAHSFTKSSERNPIVTWSVRALAELEAYLIQHGKKVNYSTNL